MTAHPGRAAPDPNGPKPFCAVFSLPNAHPGDAVRVEIDRDANVLLVDDHGLEAYSRHQPFHYVGGGYPKGHALVGIPGAGNWHVVVDLGGSPGSVQATITISHQHDAPPR